MIAYILRKLLYSVAVLYGVVTVSFFLNYVLPGDPARLMLGQRADIASVEALRAQMGLDKPLSEQYIRYLGRVAQGDLGRSYASNRDVTETIAERFPATALLAFSSIFFATALGIAIGVFSALKPYSFFDTVAMSTALLGISLPSFVVGLLMALFFGVFLDILPIAGYITNGWEYLVLPALTLGLRPLSIVARVTRSSMLDVLAQDYVRTARAKGVHERTVIVRHALRNALNPVVTTVSSWFAALLAGTFFVEYIFNWPGIGTIAIDSISKLDFPLIQGTVLFTAVIFVVVNLAVDVFYTVLDPKVKLS
jgi:peptide/nickel transport system permease protein